jgi:hypothetical protein
LSTMCVDLFPAGTMAPAQAATINAIISVTASQVWLVQKLGHKKYCMCLWHNVILTF